MIRSFNNKKPNIHSSAYIDEQATVIGNVKIGKDSALWPQAVARGDINSITIGERTNVQDGSILHVTHAGKFCKDGYPLAIGNDVTIGHSAIIHACTIENTVLVGMGSIILDGAIIKSECMIAAGALVGPGKIMESGYLYVGSPAKKLRKLSDKELEFLKYSAAGYVDLKNSYL
ncbi:MAG: gamma carbonic anhydrase family protein [Gammaproteobacteria bacterium]|jgi:carbonic anhydrase/acetyltransferase-like protein (isoleucine patch superfamily)|nr:gamma carbonic anhydrase family protein [Gammaproteobacteria bacterium]MBT3993820.1 gamma carbonic anhydrase family protein [Gammaproteobacteria bacterium]MBT4462275.1 gamma carbonic anhydrase family protein [Gammaproteobacteria bacterium]MBT4655202.1 gamma carbonic anhydrase family protein [Gammaproteobacteria bacterium]MBT5116985.1 gamma carbonic anhydrase family protein [Gammaproteobacteria bacterium]